MIGREIVRRIEALESRIDEISEGLKNAYRYSSSDPRASLTTARRILEHIVGKTYEFETGKTRNGQTLVQMLGDEIYRGAVPARITTKMHSIRTMGNLAAHPGSEIKREDAENALLTLCEVVEWYLERYEDKKPRARSRNQRKILFLVLVLFLVASVLYALLQNRGVTNHNEAARAVILDTVASKRQGASDSIEMVPLTENPPIKDSNPDVEEFVNEFVKSSNQNNVSELISYFADSAIYFGKPSSIEDIREDKINFVGRWKTRHYFIISDTKVDSLGPETWSVAYDEGYKARSFDDKTTTGSWSNQLLVKKIDDQLKIVQIEGKMKKK